MDPQLQSPKMNPEVGNSNPPLQRAEPAFVTTTTTKATLAQVVLIEDSAPAPRDNNHTTAATQRRTEEEAFENDDEQHNNESQQQHQEQEQQKETDLARPANTNGYDTHDNNNNPTAISNAANTPAPTPPPPPPAADDEEAEAGEDVGVEQEPRPKLHHLTRHWLPPEDRGTSAIEHMGASSVKEAEQKIRGMSQKELRASFQKVYGTPTSSYNNNWLRRKLYEAVGATGSTAAKRYRRVGRNDAAARKRELQRVAAAEAEAEAVEILTEIAAGPSISGSAEMAESSST